MNGYKNAIGYIRVSTQNQAEDDKYGIEVQRKEILFYADSNGYNIVEWKIDTASGTSEERPELDSILYGDDISNPPYEAVIVFKSDRVARETKLYFYYLYTLEKKRIKLLSVEEHFAEGDDFSNIYRSLLIFVAEQERNNIAIRTSKGRSLKASCGGYAGGRAPYGYFVKNGRLIVDEKEKEVVLFVYRLKEDGNSLVAISEELENAGFKTRKGGRFQSSTIKGILDNRQTYEGFYKYGKDGAWVKGVHEPILE